MGDSEIHNFVLCHQGMSYAGETLENYTNNGFKVLHQKIYKKLAGLPRCVDRCSEKHESTRRWCQTCTQWKKELQATHGKANDIKWRTSRSWTWQDDPENIIQVFVPPWVQQDYKLSDIAILCYIWKNCKTFKIDPHLCDRIKGLRNQHCAHNTKLKVGDNNKAKVFDALRDLFKASDIQPHVDRGICIKKLCDIEKEDSQNKELLRITEAILNSKDTEISNAEKIDKIQQMIVDHLIKTRKVEKKRLVCNFIMAIIFITWCTVVGGRSHLSNLWNAMLPSRASLTPGSDLSDAQGCTSEVYRYPFPQDVPLLVYLDDHERLIGRKWLFEEIEDLIFSRENNGILLQAEMGFGKSAIMRQVLCAKSGENGKRVKKHVVAFHICKFDVPSTWKVERFIRRLIGFFSSQSAEFGGEISLLSNDALIYNMESCANEPIACLDQGIISPLKRIKSEKLWIVAIDALDECRNPENNRNSILYLLKNRIRAFPSWIKFLISTRDMYEKHIMKQLGRLPLNSSDIRNIKDIEEYLDEQYLYRINVNELTGKTEKEEFKENVLKQSEGNFLFIKYALEYVMSRTKEMDVTLPAKLADIYEINFQRKFSTPGDFDVARSILQIVCASINPLNETDITEIILASVKENEATVKAALRNLSFFLNQGNTVRIIHQSLREWLMDKNNLLFYISIEEGHKLLSNYLLKSLNANKSIDFVDLVIHVASSRNDQLLRLFRSLNNKFIKSDTFSSHKLIWRSNSAAALELMLSYAPDVETLNEGGASPAFIAAARGHTEQLKLLFERGANYNFVIKERKLNVSANNTFEIYNLIKNKYFVGYGLLHIATKFKHLDTVKLILKTHPSLITVQSTTGYFASDIACECGHLQILRAFLAINESIVGEKCVYLTSKNGHEHIVDMLLKRECMRVTCINESTSLEAYNKIVKQRKNIDDWWLVFRESPLHVAVRNGHTSIAERLVDSHPDLLDCFDAFGRTPFLASIWYNRTDIFKLLSTRLSVDVEKCKDTVPKHISDLKQFQLPEFIHKKQCPFGASFPHLAAIFDRSDMILYVLKNRLPVNWTAVDSFLNPPDHYAACAGSLFYLIAAKEGYLSHDIDEMRAANGSSVYHIAALCTNTIGIVVLKGVNLKDGIPKYLDNNNRSILHYSVLRRPLKNSVDIQRKTASIINTLIADGHSLTKTDSFGRNVLHYMFSNGYDLLVKDVYITSKTQWVRLMRKVDRNGFTPVTYAISKNHDIYRVLFVNCFISVSCNLLEISYNMPPWQETVLQTIIIDKGTNIQIPSKLFTHLFNVCPYLTKALLMHLNPQDSDLKQELLYQLDNPTGISEQFRYSLVALYVHKPHIFHVCSDDLNRSPLHKMALNIKHSYGLFSHDLEFLQRFVNRHDLEKYASCPDNNGYNVFHYALIGGNTPTAEVLLNYNVLVTNSKVGFEDILWMTLLSRVNSEGYHTIEIESYCSGQPYLMIRSQMSCADSFLEMFINKYGRKFRRSVFCNPNTKSLSLIHLMSLNGMVRTITMVSKLYGQRVLDCFSKHGFTPYYMWRLFHDEDDWVKLRSGRATVIFPHHTAEDVLLFKLKNDFPLAYTSKAPLKCLFKFRKEKWKRANRRTRFKIIMCLLKAISEAKCELHVFDLKTKLDIISMQHHEIILLLSTLHNDTVELALLECDLVFSKKYLDSLRRLLNSLLPIVKLNNTKLYHTSKKKSLQLLSKLSKGKKSMP